MHGQLTIEIGRNIALKQKTKRKNNTSSLLELPPRDKKPRPLQLLGSGAKEEDFGLEFLCKFFWLALDLYAL